MRYSFEAKLEQWEGSGGWYYCYLPKELWSDIRELTSDTKKRGFGAVAVVVTIGTTSWSTSVFPDTKAEKYILFIKKAVRTAEKLELGTRFSAELKVEGL